MILRPALRSLVRPLVRSLHEGHSGFSPRLLFAAGEQGGWWDPSDFSTMFQDSAGTTPVTATGQPVGLIRDKSGRGNHRTQTTAASRPTLQQDASGYYYLAYDGVDDFMVTGSVDFSSSDKVTVWAGVNKQSDAAIGAILHLGNAGAAGVFGMLVPVSTASGASSFRAAGGDSVVAEVQTSSGVAPEAMVLTGSANMSGSASQQITIRKNGTPTVGGTTSGGNFSNAPLYFGRRAGTTLPFTGREYQTIIRGAAASAAQIAQAERYLGSKMGIAL